MTKKLDTASGAVCSQHIPPVRPLLQGLTAEYQLTQVQVAVLAKSRPSGPSAGPWLWRSRTTALFSVGPTSWRSTFQGWIASRQALLGAHHHWRAGHVVHRRGEIAEAVSSLPSTLAMPALSP